MKLLVLLLAGYGSLSMAVRQSEALANTETLLNVGIRVIKILIITS